MPKRVKKNIIILMLLLIPLFCFADRATEVAYPNVPGLTIKPTTIKMLLPDYIRYVFNLFVTISGFICFGSLVYAGVLYVSSAGNPLAQKEAINQIKMAFIGVAIILGSYLVSNTINPQLVMPEIGIRAAGGVTLYSSPGCAGESKDFMNDMPNFGVKSDETPFIAQSLRFISRPGELKVILFDEENYSGNQLETTSELTSCRDGWAKKSIKFLWQLPGVYLCDTPLTTDASGCRCEGNEKYLPADTALLEPDLNNNVKGVRFNNLDNPPMEFGVVLHEKPDWRGKCEYRDVNSPSPIDLDISSVTTFAKGSADSGGVWLCKDAEGRDCKGPFQDVEGNFGHGDFSEVPNAEGPLANGVSSIFIEGGYMLILCEGSDLDGDCEVFTKTDSNLIDNQMGRCWCLLGNFGCTDCASSAKIFPIRGSSGGAAPPEEEIPPPSEECTIEGEKRCNAALTAVEECQDEGGNLIWNVVEACDPGLSTCVSYPDAYCEPFVSP